LTTGATGVGMGVVAGALHISSGGGSSIGLISWPRDARHMVREMHGTLCI